MQNRDADQELFRQSAKRFAIRMGLVSAGMVFAGAAMFFSALWWKATFGSSKPDAPRHVTISFEPVDLFISVAMLGAGAIVLASAAAFYFARQATQPLAEAMERQKNFIADASHELRTPLAVMHARVQQLQALSAGNEKIAPVAKELRRDTQDMVDIVNDLLEIASTTTDLDATASLSGALADLEHNQSLIATQRGISLAIPARDADTRISMSEVSLHRCLNALVGNALSHTPTGGHVALHLEETDKEVTVRITDDGPGITGIEPSRVFDRFASGTPGRDQAHGIGLALVKDAVHRFGGTVGVENTGPKGTTFALTLKKAD